MGAWDVGWCSELGIRCCSGGVRRRISGVAGRHGGGLQMGWIDRVVASGMVNVVAAGTVLL